MSWGNGFRPEDTKHSLLCVWCSLPKQPHHADFFFVLFANVQGMAEADRLVVVIIANTCPVVAAVDTEDTIPTVEVAMVVTKATVVAMVTVEVMAAMGDSVVGSIGGETRIVSSSPLLQSYWRAFFPRCLWASVLFFFAHDQQRACIMPFVVQLVTARQDVFLTIFWSCRSTVTGFLFLVGDCYPFFQLNSSAKTKKTKLNGVSLLGQGFWRPFGGRKIKSETVLKILHSSFVLQWWGWGCNISQTQRARRLKTKLRDFFFNFSSTARHLSDA